MSTSLTMLAEHPQGYVFWHGAQRWEGRPEIRPSKKGAYEHGPGLYLTTGLNTAKAYAKGSGCLVEVELSAHTRWLEDTPMDFATVRAFAATWPGLRRRMSIVQDLDDHMARVQARWPDRTTIHGEILLNLCVNYAVLSGEHGPRLAAFLVDQGADATVAQTRAGGETWAVVFNPEVITATRVHRVATVASDADCPPFADQHARLTALRVAATAVIAPRPRA